ncbi:hypothetical protein BGZ76_010463 [Entomortierella beljakovae]|nr:hypothetical protein BGZ76_010463 [Entomortierella beljakovae]
MGASASVLPSHNIHQYKDKPRGGNGIPSPTSPSGFVGRLTPRRIIIAAGGTLFVYIILTTAFGPTHDIGHPATRRKEYDPYVDIPNLDQNINYSPDVVERPPRPVPAIQLEPVISPYPEANPPDTRIGQEDPNSGSYQIEEMNSSTGDSAIVDDEGDITSPPPPPEPVEETELSIAIKQRKASPMSYAQVLSATRRERNYAIALMVREADIALNSTEVYSVTNKNQTAPSGDIHDYLSLSKYYWPNPNKKNGLPYKRIDGHVNPEIETVRDYRLLRSMIREVHILGMSYHFTGRKAYLEKSVMRLKEWFLDEATYMNPNINYGSLRKGEKFGARTGVLDMFTIFRVFDALHYLKQDPDWPHDLIPQLQEWFTRYVKWLETSPLAQVERDGDNNHGTYFDVQIIGIYLFLGRVDDAREVAQKALQKRIDPQINSAGLQPEEMARKTSWYYSVFNLQALMTLARWGDDLGVDMWFYEGPQGQSIKKAIDFMLPYSLSGGEGWPVENLKGFDMTDYLKCLQIAWYIYGDEKYIDAIAKLEPLVQKDMDDGKIKTVSTFMCDMSTLLEANTRGGQGFIWHWCLT